MRPNRRGARPRLIPNNSLLLASEAWKGVGEAAGALKIESWTLQVASVVLSSSSLQRGMPLAGGSVDLKGYELAAAHLLSRWPCSGATDNRARDRAAVVLEVRPQHLARRDVWRLGRRTAEPPPGPVGQRAAYGTETASAR
jgi:hypothetical protein